jgi:hypothetical protein
MKSPNAFFLRQGVALFAGCLFVSCLLSGCLVDTNEESEVTLEDELQLQADQMEPDPEPWVPLDLTLTDANQHPDDDDDRLQRAHDQQGTPGGKEGKNGDMPAPD